MVDPKIIREWLDKADEDFGFASVSMDDEVEYFPQICFHFQQAAEKYLKSYIVAHELEFKKIHELRVLLKICSKHNKDMVCLKDACEKLDQYYIETRYPVHWPTKFAKTDAVEAKEASAVIGNYIKNILRKFL